MNYFVKRKLKVFDVFGRKKDFYREINIINYHGENSTGRGMII